MESADSPGYATSSAGTSSSKEGVHIEPGTGMLKPGTIVIAIMGVTGSGKSTFISHFTSGVEISHGLESCKCTSNVEIFKCSLPDGTPLYLVDTPGFDDTYKTDSDVLRDVANWLNMTYENKVRLSGIVYLHRIGDTRLGGSSMRNLRMFQKLVGDEGLGSVVLATTMWSAVGLSDSEMQVAELREQELQTKPQFWKSMMDKGSSIFRQDSGYESALEIVSYLVQKQRPVTLDVQRDMIDGGLALEKTAAGREVGAEILKQQELYEARMKETNENWQYAIENMDKEQQKEIQEYRKEIQKKIRDNEKALEQLSAEKDQLREQLRDEWQEEREKLMKDFNRQQAEQRQEEKRRLEEQRQAEELRAKEQLLDKQQQKEIQEYQKEIQTKMRDNEKALEQLSAEKDQLREQLRNKWHKEREKLIKDLNRQKAKQRKKEKRDLEEQRHAECIRAILQLIPTETRRQPQYIPIHQPYVWCRYARYTVRWYSCDGCRYTGPASFHP
ncbi:hypothetical protein G7Z17_g3936 [Cylindrodendrum hubeiense]|uniref:G domain-containing protein n=1 Tax=Cylindrodendrum hubeiense TaxID=595255 RepID=A0A9P5H9S8_9HYPO|nr:hypothetical protein G7Z17_g3936 [Cylindrodendrum hubeiense]